ncbi:alcohol dehydrogenase catalytic domain-containing protein [Streptomyces sp. NPDC004610]|uniref:alcohol dehydrogenase catalytic domain-containing protein n=1 Tax=unclassified Streptomyces TaxID=2593676 RepID=UPI0033B96119
MHAVVLRPPSEPPGSARRRGLITIEDVAVVEPGPTEVQVRVEACGICGTDLDACQFHGDNTSAFGGPIALPVVLGHEVSGTVAAVGERVTRVAPGDLVALESIQSCGTCDTCLLGLRNQCANVTLAGLTSPGGFAEYITVPETTCHSLAPLLEQGWDADRAILAGCLLEPLGCVYNALFIQGGGLRPGERVTVHGLGPLGLFACLLCRIAGASRVIGIDPLPERRAMAAKFGFDCHAPAPGGSWPSDRHLAERGALSAEVHVEASGNPAATLPVIERSLLPNSRCIVLSRTDLPTRIDTNPWVSSAARLIGSRGQSGGVFPYLIRLFAAGILDPGELIGDTFPFREVPRLLRGGSLENAGKTVMLSQRLSSGAVGRGQQRAGAGGDLLGTGPTLPTEARAEAGSV